MGIASRELQHCNNCSTQKYSLNNTSGIREPQWECRTFVAAMNAAAEMSNALETRSDAFETGSNALE